MFTSRRQAGEPERWALVKAKDHSGKSSNATICLGYFAKGFLTFDVIYEKKCNVYASVYAF